jgi:hypothetical protein
VQERRANFECQSVLENRRYCQSIKFFTNFHPKFEMPIYMKVVSLNKMDNFDKGRFLSVYVNFGERGKSSGRHSLMSTVKPVLTVSLTKGPLRVCVGLAKGFIRVHWRGFRVMTQVDLGLTGV